jgi:hypothetical protein
MTREELDTLWNKSVNESIRAGDSYARYRFAEFVAAAEREAQRKLLTEIRDALRRMDPAWCALHDAEQISDEELDELIGRVEDAVEDSNL